MAKNWALVIGVNAYNPLNFPALKYAKQDAEKIEEFFRKAGFERVFLFSDDSSPQELPNGNRIPTRPTYGNLRSFLNRFFEKTWLSSGDNFWFFFAGHGLNYRGQDYLMPMDASVNQEGPDCALSVNYIRERLCLCGADNVILLLDACRSEGGRDGLSIGEEIQPGVITISSCQPSQKSWEIDELKQGVFTYVLLEAFNRSGEHSCATVERLSSYLKWRTPELCRKYKKAPAQIPRICVDPIEKQHLILLPQCARQSDVDLLKLDIYRLQSKNPLFAEKICMRLNALAKGQDPELMELFLDIRSHNQNINNLSVTAFENGTEVSDQDAKINRTLSYVSRWNSSEYAPSKKTAAEIHRAVSKKLGATNINEIFNQRPDWKMEITDALNFMEELALIHNLNLIDAELSKKFFNSIVINYYDLFESFIIDARNQDSNDGIYSQLSELVDFWKNDGDSGDTIQ